MKIGFIDIGLMGELLAKNLICANKKVYIAVSNKLTPLKASVI